MGHIILILWRPGNFELNTSCDEFYPVVWWIFLYSINILMHLSRIQLSYLEIVWSIWILLLGFVRQDQGSVKSRANFSQLLRQNPFEYSTQCSMNYGFILLWLWVLSIVPCNLKGWVFYWPQVVFLNRALLLWVLSSLLLSALQI